SGGLPRRSRRVTDMFQKSCSHDCSLRAPGGSSRSTLPGCAWSTQRRSGVGECRRLALVGWWFDEAPAEGAEHAARAASPATAAGSLLNAASAAIADNAAATSAIASAPLPTETSASKRRTAHSVGESSLLCAAA